MPVKTFLSHFAIEALNKAVLDRFTISYMT